MDKDRLDQNIYKTISAFIIFALFSIFAAKMFFNLERADSFLYFYGLSITLVLLITFFIALVIYKDPYLSVQNLKAKDDNFASCMVAVKDEEEKEFY